MTTAPPMPAPFAVTLDHALRRIDQTLGIAAMLADEGQDRTAPYYAQSRIGYDRLHSGKGCMHVALNPDGQFHRKGFLAQARATERQITRLGARRVLELGAGLGFNARHLARAHPDLEVVALDLLPAHVEQIASRARADGLNNVTALQGAHEGFPPGLGRFDVILAVETLCYAADPDRVAAEIAAHLAPGGCLVLFDPFARQPEEALPEPLALATRLYRLGVALTRPLWPVARWRAALAAAGLVLRDESDLTLQALPGLMRLQAAALSRTERVTGRIALRVLPRYLARNAATALTGPFACFGPGPDPDPARGSVSYHRLIAERPA